MKKEIILIVGSSSWWKNIKFRREAASELKKLRNNWKLYYGEKIILSSQSIDTKIYKRYYFYK